MNTSQVIAALELPPPMPIPSNAKEADRLASVHEGTHMVFGHDHGVGFEKGKINRGRCSGKVFSQELRVPARRRGETEADALRRGYEYAATFHLVGFCGEAIILFFDRHAGGIESDVWNAWRVLEKHYPEPSARIEKMKELLAVARLYAQANKKRIEAVGGALVVYGELSYEDVVNILAGRGDKLGYEHRLWL